MVVAVVVIVVVVVDDLVIVVVGVDLEVDGLSSSALSDRHWR